jgi:cell division control protein 24
MRQWEAAINRLIRESAQRRATERGVSGMSRIASSTGFAPRPMPRVSQSSYGTHHSMYSSQSSTSAASSRGPRTPYSSDEQVGNINAAVYGSGPQGYPSHNGFEFEADEDDFEDYPPSAMISTPGRETPVGYRRNNAMSMPPERDAIPGYDRPRAHTEDTNGPVMAQWRNGLPPVPMHHGSISANGPRPQNSRMNSNMSTNSYASDSSFGSNTAPRARPPLRSQFSSSKLKSVHDGTEHRTGTPSPSPPQQPLANGLSAPIMNRSRSASQPIAYIPKGAAPPLPPTAQQWGRERSHTAMGMNKRGSGSSQSTGESSDYSPNSSSPITPFGSSESSLGAVGIHSSRSQHFDNGVGMGIGVGVGMGMGMGNSNGNGNGPPVKVKVHFHEDIFVIQVARSTEYEDLVERVGRKIRLCGPRRDDGPLRVRYKDEDGDMVSLGSTEDVQMAFEQYRPGGQVTLFVT